MRPWDIREYVTAGGRKPFSEWYLRIDVKAQAEFDVTLLTLRQTYDDWTVCEGDEFKTLTDEDEGFCEIRFWIDHDHKYKRGEPLKRRFRVFILYEPLQSVVILFGGFEKEHGGQKVIPPNALKQIRKHRQRFEANEGTTVKYV